MISAEKQYPDTSWQNDSAPIHSKHGTTHFCDSKQILQVVNVRHTLSLTKIRLYLYVTCANSQVQLNVAAASSNQYWQKLIEQFSDYHYVISSCMAGGIAVSTVWYNIDFTWFTITNAHMVKDFLKKVFITAAICCMLLSYRPIVSYYSSM